MFKKISLLLLLAAFGLKANAQCTWSTYFYDSFEYSTVIPYIVPGTTYQNTPQTYAGCVHAGANGLYLNFTDNYSGLVYDQPFTNLCVGQSYRFSFWTRDAWTGVNNMTFQVLDASNNIISTQNVINNGTWQNIIMPAFTATTANIRFQIITNTPGGGGNDAGLDELTLSVCSTANAGNDNSASYCGAGPVVDMNTFLSAGSTTGGTWSETTTPPSGAFTAATGSWNTAGLNPGTYTFTYNVTSSAGCGSDAATFTMIIGNIPEVDLGPDTTLCIGQNMTLNAGTYDTYQWNNGSTNPTKYVTNPGGLYWVKVGTLGANQIVNGGFESGNTGFTTQYTPGTGGTWGALSNPGTYAITTSPNLVHTNFNSCTDHTVAPGVNQFVVNGAATANTQVWCQTVPVQPNTTYQFGTWATAVESGQPAAQLQFTINGVQLGPIFSPSLTGCSWTQFTQTWLSTAASNAQICIVNQNTAGGGNDFAIDDITFRPICYSIDTIVVSFSPNPVVNLGPDQNHCEGTPVTLDAQNPGMEYLWGGGEDTQTLDVTTTGVQTVTVTNPFGCTGTDNVNITFEAQKTAGNDSLDFACSTTTAYALSDLFSTGTTTGGTWESLTAGYGGTLATNGDLGLTGQAGTFNFQYVVFGTYCPNDTSNFELTIHQQPVAAPDQSLHFCNTSGLVEDFSGYLNHPFEPIPGAWQSSANVPAGSFDATTSQFDLTDVPHDNYSFDYILPSDPGCVQDTTTIDVQVTAVPQIDFISDVAEGCQPLTVNFTNASTVQGNTVYTWDLGDGTGSNSFADVNNTYETAACYDITLTALSDGLCSSTLTLSDMICVHAVPDAAFNYNPQQVYSDGPVVNFDNLSQNHDFSDWSFGDGGTSTAENPEHTYPVGEIGNYEVQLIVTTQFGCSDTAYRAVIVKDQLLYYVPNTFTPDNDENNPIFLPIMTAGMDENDFSLEIYNRWGEMVFATKDINEGWDGTYNGEKAKEGTYIWKIRFGLLESDGAETAIGHVNLIR